jgi:hypothetical protein
MLLSKRQELLTEWVEKHGSLNTAEEVGGPHAAGHRGAAGSGCHDGHQCRNDLVASDP